MDKLPTDAIEWCIEETEWMSDCTTVVAKQELYALIARVAELERDRDGLLDRARTAELWAKQYCDEMKNLVARTHELLLENTELKTPPKWWAYSGCKEIEKARRDGYALRDKQSGRAPGLYEIGIAPIYPSYDEAIAAQKAEKDGTK